MEGERSEDVSLSSSPPLGKKGLGEEEDKRMDFIGWPTPVGGKRPPLGGKKKVGSLHPNKRDAPSVTSARNGGERGKRKKFQRM